MDTTEAILTIAEKKRKKAEEAAATGPRRSTYLAEGSAPVAPAQEPVPEESGPGEPEPPTEEVVVGIAGDGVNAHGLRYDWNAEQASSFDFEQIDIDRWAKVADIRDEISGKMSLSQLQELMFVCEETAAEHTRRAENARRLALRIGRAVREAFEPRGS